MSTSSQHVMVTDRGVFMHQVAWSPPPDKSWKLNFSSFVSRTPMGPGGAAFIIRDENAVFKYGFSTPLRRVRYDHLPGLVALSNGLGVAISLGIEHLEVVGDCSDVLLWLSCEGIPRGMPSSIRKLLRECRRYMRAFRSVTVSYLDIHRNAAANRLARLVVHDNEPHFWPNSPPWEIARILLDDVIGLWVRIAGP